MNYKIKDFCIHKPNLGVYFYEDKVYPRYEEGTKSYKFNLIIVPENFSIAQRLGDKPLVYETVNFIATLDFSKYLKKVELSEKQKIKYNKEYAEVIDYKLIIETFYKDLNISINRLERKIKNKTIEPSFLGNKEFLEFDDETAEYWCDPYSKEEKKGCIVYFRGLPQKDLLNDMCLENSLTSWGIPEVYRDDSYDEMSTEEKKKFLKSLPLKTLINLYKNNLNEEDFLYYNKYLLTLCGNDDLSYSKGFNTLEEYNKEIEYLRNIQPLNFFKDVVERDYIFTN